MRVLSAPTLECAAGIISCLAFNPRQPGMLASGSYSSVAAIWDTASAQLLCLLQGHTGGITQVRGQRGPPACLAAPPASLYARPCLRASNMLTPPACACLQPFHAAPLLPRRQLLVHWRAAGRRVALLGRALQRGRRVHAAAPGAPDARTKSVGMRALTPTPLERAVGAHKPAHLL